MCTESASTVADVGVASNSSSWWCDHANRLTIYSGIYADHVQDLLRITAFANIGDGEGQIRPGCLGQLDVYAYFRAQGLLDKVAVFLAGMQLADIGLLRRLESGKPSSPDQDPDVMVGFKDDSEFLEALRKLLA
jgi:hypothetical protein